MPVIYGYNSAVAAGTETIWAHADQRDLWLPPTAARVHALVSTDVKDDGSPAGVGAQTVLVTGINGSGLTTSEVVTMNGTTPVNTANSYVHVSELRVLAVGSELDNAGRIDATAATDSTISAFIVAGANVSNGAILYCAGGGEQLHVRSVTVSASGLTDGATSIEIALVHKPSGLARMTTTIACLWSGASAAVTVPLDLMLGYGDWIRLDATSSDAAAKVAATINYAKVA
jgi:hypothetical protein